MKGRHVPSFWECGAYVPAGTPERGEYESCGRQNELEKTVIANAGTQCKQRLSPIISRIGDAFVVVVGCDQGHYEVWSPDSE
jgi:hypothetical protein